MIAYWEALVRKYPIASIETDSRRRRKGWIEATRRLGAKILLVGDDVFVTNSEILARGLRTASRTRCS